MTRKTAIFTIVNERGLHARAATKLVQVASKFPCEVSLRGASSEEVTNGKSVMGVLLLCGIKGSKIEVLVDGEQADDALKAIGELIADKFGEGE